VFRTVLKYDNRLRERYIWNIEFKLNPPILQPIISCHVRVLGQEASMLRARRLFCSAPVRVRIHPNYLHESQTSQDIKKIFFRMFFQKMNRTRRWLFFFFLMRILVSLELAHLPISSPSLAELKPVLKSTKGCEKRPVHLGRNVQMFPQLAAHFHRGLTLLALPPGSRLFYFYIF